MKVKSQKSVESVDLAGAFWSVPPAELLGTLHSAQNGMTSAQASQGLSEHGPNVLRSRKRTDAFTLLLAQFKSPIILILVFAAGLSFFLHDQTDSAIILAIIVVSGILGFWQERGANHAVEKLLSIVRTKCTVHRDGKEQEIPLEEIVPGDVVTLSAGAVIPGDGLLLESRDLFVDEAALTGESYPVEKEVATLAKETPLAQRTNCVFMGTHVVSGTANAVIVHTGRATEFGKVSEELRLRSPETEFEHGIRRFGFFLMEVTLVLILLIFVFNVLLKKPVLDSFLFSLALAVGLTPQLLPAIISINLSRGARKMADKKVIVKRLAAIENFGSMNVLCADKTGTLTQGVIQIHSTLDALGEKSERVHLLACLNSGFESGFANPIDDAVRSTSTFDLAAYHKLDEIPYDFTRKRVSILVEKDGAHLMITKGAVSGVLSVCSQVEDATGKIVPLSTVADSVAKLHESLSLQGLRTLAVAFRDTGAETRIGRDHEKDMTLVGFLVLYDPPKPDVKQTLAELHKLGIHLKIITGDSKPVAQSLSNQVGIDGSKIITGPEMRQLSDEALMRRANLVNVFAEIEPNQKERIIVALKKSGRVVGFMGDGINDASALHAADVGLSVNTAVDVAKEAADIVLLERDLGVLAQGVNEGRATFANTLKYVFMATSANFGNMFSMAGASLFMPFLPLLPKQILFMNLMTDFPEMAIASDSVDAEMITKPRRWNMKFIRNFMLVFGSLSSIFDYLTFGLLLLIFHADAEQFRTGWFIESVVSATAIVLVVRSRRPFFRSKPGVALQIATLLVICGTFIVPYTALGTLFGFVPLPLSILALILGIVVLYMASAEVAKRIFYAKAEPSTAGTHRA